MSLIKWIVVTIVTLVMLPNLAFADQPISLIRTLCMNEDGLSHFSAHTESFAEAAWYINLGGQNAPKEKVARIGELKKYGILYPHDFEYTCKLPKDSFSISGNRDQGSENGACMGDPRIQLSLTNNNKTIVNSVFFEASCFSDISDKKDGYPYLESFALEESKGYVILRLSAFGEKKDLLIYLGNKNTFNQETLNCLAAKGYFESKGAVRRQALKMCWETSKE